MLEGYEVPGFYTYRENAYAITKGFADNNLSLEEIGAVYLNLCNEFLEGSYYTAPQKKIASNKLALRIYNAIKDKMARNEEKYAKKIEWRNSRKTKEGEE